MFYGHANKAQVLLLLNKKTHGFSKNGPAFPLESKLAKPFTHNSSSAIQTSFSLSRVSKLETAKPTKFRFAEKHLKTI